MFDKPVLEHNEFDNNKKYWSKFKEGTTTKLTMEFRDQVITWFLPEELLKKSKVLDLGCGYGRMNIFYNFKLYVGIDTTPEMIAHARILNLFKNAFFTVGNGKDLHQIHNETFDLVISSTVFLHLKLSTAKKYVKEVWRILKPNGIFLVNLPKTCNLGLSEFADIFKITNVGEYMETDYVYKLEKKNENT